MGKTIIGLGDPKAVKRYSGALAVDIAKESYFTKKFMGEGATAEMPIQRLTELESDAGEQITFDLSVQLKQQPIEGDNVQEGTEEGLEFYTDSIYIDQVRGGVNTGGKMTRKRTMHNLREIARSRQAEWWARLFDETLFCYLSGARGINDDFIYPTDWTGRANNPMTAPDAQHLLLPNGHTKATLVAGDKATVGLIDIAVGKSKTMGGGIQGVPRIQPIRINGEKRFVALFSPWQIYDIRQDVGANGWLEIQKAAATQTGASSPIFTGALGMHNGVVLHEHESVIRFSDYGAGGNVPAARALFLGKQAGSLAFGSPGTGLRFSWYEESRDNGNQAVISTSCIWGCKKTTFNGLDFGIMAMDTAAVAAG